MPWICENCSYRTINDQQAADHMDTFNHECLWKPVALHVDIKSRWIEALRSGKYEQGKYQLRTWDNKFCCLGVLCDIVNPEGWETDDHGDLIWGDLGSFLGLKALIAAGLPESFDQTLLTSQNDKEGKSFEEIADWIERNL